MAIKVGNVASFKGIGAKLAMVTIAGTIQSSGLPVIRTVLVYKNQSASLQDSTESDSSGNFSIDVPGGSNDCFRVIAVGIENENSVIYEHICA